LANEHDRLNIVEREHVKFFVEIFGRNKDLYSLLKQNLVPNTLYSDEENYQYLPEQTLKNLVMSLAKNKTDIEFCSHVWSGCKDIYIPRLVSRITQLDTVKDALDQFCAQLKTASNDVNFYTQFKGNRWWFVRDKKGINEDWFKHAEMFSVIFMSQLLKSLTNNKWQVTEVSLRCAEDSSFKSIPELKGAIFYTHRPVTALQISDKLMSAPAFSDYSGQPLLPLPANDLPLNSTFLSSFKIAIRPYLSMGKLPITLAAKITNLNVRTLQRRLAKYGAVYSEIVEELIMEQVLDLLKNKSIPITAIALKFGYSDTPHFTRAFKRQTKFTPSQYRRLYF
jgi:AraC-like DNA-binding protein